MMETEIFGVIIKANGRTSVRKFCAGIGGKFERVKSTVIG